MDNLRREHRSYLQSCGQSLGKTIRDGVMSLITPRVEGTKLLPEPQERECYLAGVVAFGRGIQPVHCDLAGESHGD